MVPRPSDRDLGIAVRRRAGPPGEVSAGSRVSPGSGRGEPRCPSGGVERTLDTFAACRGRTPRETLMHFSTAVVTGAASGIGRALATRIGSGRVEAGTGRHRRRGAHRDGRRTGRHRGRHRRHRSRAVRGAGRRRAGRTAGVPERRRGRHGHRPTLGGRSSGVGRRVRRQRGWTGQRVARVRTPAARLRATGPHPDHRVAGRAARVRRRRSVRRLQARCRRGGRAGRAGAVRHERRSHRAVSRPRADGHVPHGRGPGRRRRGRARRGARRPFRRRRPGRVEYGDRAAGGAAGVGSAPGPTRASCGSYPHHRSRRTDDPSIAVTLSTALS